MHSHSGPKLNMNCHYYTFSQVFSPEECDKIIELGKETGTKPGTVSQARVVDTRIRNSDVSFLTNTHVSRFVYDALALRILSANLAEFGFDLSSVPFLHLPSVQFTEYKAEQEQHYDWHVDNFWTGQSPSDRKLSCVVQLSSPSDYSGGRLEIEHTEIPANRFVQRGDLIVFPSPFRHRVTPVTSGTRHSLVTWAYGPRFK